MSDSLTAYFDACRQRVEHHLDTLLPPATRTPQRLHEAMRYSALSDGKRIRPVLAYATGEALGIEADIIDPAAAAVELIHAYSLIHDDLPAMDDDDLRRGKPTCHIKFDEATAILAGDALQTLAFGSLADPSNPLPAERRGEMVQQLANASGSRGMAGGQALDLNATGTPLTLAELENIHIHKTGALIRCSVMLGAMCAEQLTDTTRQALDHYAKCIGLAFQIVDDILDVTSDTETLGKTQGKDAVQQKRTYPDLLGLEGAHEKAREMINEALASLDSLGERADRLREIAAFILDRTR